LKEEEYKILYNFVLPLTGKHMVSCMRI